jgi:hypothetical protein
MKLKEALTYWFMEFRRRTLKERGILHSEYILRKFDVAGKLYETLRFAHNCFLNEGINELWTILCSAGGTKFDNTNGFTGVGNSATAAQPTDTGLLGASKTYKAMDATYPTYGTSQKATFRSTFQSAEGNHDWNECTVANGNSDSAKNLNRKVQAMGTKTSGTVWELTIELTIT